MKKTFSGLVLICGAMIFNACSDKKKDLSESEIHAKVDSIVGTKVEEINRQAMEDLDRRLSIEVKAKADSIVQSHMSPAAAPKTPHPPADSIAMKRAMPHLLKPMPQPAGEK